MPHDPLQTYRAHVINLCFSVIDSCSLTDIDVLKQQAALILGELGITARPMPPVVSEDFGDLL